MPGPNTLNTPNPNDYVFGRGAVYACELASDDTYKDGSWVHLGNCPDFNPSFAVTEVDHFSSISGLKTLDQSTIVEATGKLAFTLEEFNEFNLAKFLLGDVVTFTNPAVAGFSNISQLYTSVTLGRWYDLVDSSGTRLYDISDTTKIVLKKHAGAVTLTINTDYVLDTKWGRVRLLPTASSIATGDDLDLTCTAGASATSSIRRIEGLTTVGKNYAIKFIFVNAANGGGQLHVQFNKVELSPTGDLAMITGGNNYAQMKFDGKCLQSAWSRFSASPTVSVDWHANA